jgi:spore coat polysaccharide biosynthesis protein SpsF
MPDQGLKKAVIIQARMGAQRFPGKMMQGLAGVPLVEYVYRRCVQSRIKNVLVATSDDSSDDTIFRHCESIGMPVIRGELHNVLKRFIQAAQSLKAEYIIRVCADTPFVDTSLFEVLLQALIDEGLDYVAPDKKTCASGFLSEAITINALLKTARITTDKEDLEHVTRFIINNPGDFRLKLVQADLRPEFINSFRFTVDYPQDLGLANEIVNNLADKYNFTSHDVINVLQRLQGCNAQALS